MRAGLSIALSALTAMMWAVPNEGAARFISKGAASAVRPASRQPLPARFRIQKESGLLLKTWINGNGPYIFAVDTGAGLNVITQRVASEARLTVRTVPRTIMGGLTAASISSSREGVISRLALGDAGNFLPANKSALIVSSLGPDIDGILDPTEAYAPYGYSIDMPHQRIEALDTSASSLQSRYPDSERAVVTWLRADRSNRPFVRLGDGRVALVDTGSGFGLAVNERHAIIVGSKRGSAASEGTRDIAGGTIMSRRVSPTTVSVGELVLRHVPTDILFGVQEDAPVILGREALYPFKITFDPQRRLIEFVASSENN